MMSRNWLRLPAALSTWLLFASQCTTLVPPEARLPLTKLWPVPVTQSTTALVEELGSTNSELIVQLVGSVRPRTLACSRKKPRSPALEPYNWRLSTRSCSPSYEINGMCDVIDTRR